MGHLKETDFEAAYKNWQWGGIENLFEAPIVERVSEVFLSPCKIKSNPY
jgi:hypothetical protein